MTTLKEVLQTLDGFKVHISITEIQELNLACKSTLRHYLSNTEAIKQCDKIHIEGVLDYTYEQINIGNWKDVGLFLRKTMTIASYLKLLAYFRCSDEVTEEILRESFKIIDYGLLFGCPIEKEPNLLQKCASYLNSLYLQLFNFQDVQVLEEKCSESIPKQYDATDLEILNWPSMEHFFKNYILAEKPVVLDNCINHWPALTKWKDQNYLMKLAGLRTVSVELGSQYTDSEWTQKIMTVGEFINKHVNQSSGDKGYLAQYQLFDQIPELKYDIMEPEYCCFSDNNDPVDIMAWYGPKGTVSPLHHDPKRNLLAQVVGEKQVFLYSPQDSEFLYPHEHELMDNTARVDPRTPDLEKYPNYKQAKPYYCVLRPGQLLYIPPKWWHFVESLSISFSVSFWWM